MNDMKTTTPITALCILLATAAFSQMKIDYKKPALDILFETQELLEERVALLTDEELRYIPKDGGWSVLNCLEHLAFVERALHGNLKELIEAGEQEEAKDLSNRDWLIISQVTDRTKKVKTVPPLEPRPEMKDKGKEFFILELKKYRKKTRALLESAQVDLRKVIGPYLYGNADAIQQAIIIGAHSYRHTMQIEEILAELHSLK